MAVAARVTGYLRVSVFILGANGSTVGVGRVESPGSLVESLCEYNDTPDLNIRIHRSGGGVKWSIGLETGMREKGKPLG